jgi:hypothetical protein
LAGEPAAPIKVATAPSNEHWRFARFRQHLTGVKTSGISPAQSVLSTIAPIIVTTAIVIAIAMAMGFTYANGNARFAAIDANAAATTDTITIPRMTMSRSA